MPQVNALIIRIRQEQTEEFERLFAEEELPLWDEFAGAGKFLRATISRVAYGTDMRDGVQTYLICVEVPTMAEHSAHDRDPRFNAFLEKVKPLQPVEPGVYGGDSIHERP
jgi:hypothetical protein